MSPVEAKFLMCRATAVAMNARRKPECAPAARNWISLAARHAKNNGQSGLADEIRRTEQSILGN